MLAAAERLGATLGLRASINPRWGELQLRVEDDKTRLITTLAADPVGVDMDRVASAMQAIDQLASRRLAPGDATAAIRKIEQRRPAATWLFMLAAAAGAVALAVIFGVQHAPAAGLIFVSAGAGAALRRGLAHYSGNIFLQPFAAALLSGLIGAVAVRYQLSSLLRLVAVCPCMILVPGPHVLNGALDIVEGRVHLGMDRLFYAGLVILAISTGLLLGLALLGVSLPVDSAGHAVPLWQDVIAAGVAVAAYSVFFSTPTAMIAWPVAVGMIARAALVGAFRAGRQRSHRRGAGMSRCRNCPNPGRATLAHAVCGYRLCRRRVGDPGGLSFPDGERPRPARRGVPHHD